MSMQTSICVQELRSIVQINARLFTKSFYQVDWELLEFTLISKEEYEGNIRDHNEFYFFDLKFNICVSASSVKTPLA